MAARGNAGLHPIDSILKDIALFGSEVKPPRSFQEYVRRRLSPRDLRGGELHVKLPRKAGLCEIGADQFRFAAARHSETQAQALQVVHDLMEALLLRHSFCHHVRNPVAAVVDEGICVRYSWIVFTNDVPRQRAAGAAHRAVKLRNRMKAETPRLFRPADGKQFFRIEHEAVHIEDRAANHKFPSTFVFSYLPACV